MKKNNSNVKKLFSIVLAATLLVSALAGCTEKANDKDENGRTVISVGSWPTKAGTSLDNMNARKARFEENNPDVVIEPDEWAFDLKTFYAKAAGGQLPTVYTTNYTEAAQIISSGYSTELTDILSEYGYDGKFNQQVLDVVSKDGKIYAFPFASYAVGLAYNVDLMEAAGLMQEDGTPMQPKDWEEVREFAVKIKEATGKAGFLFPTGAVGGWLFTCLAWSYGVDFMEQDNEGNWKATFNTAECAEALQWLKDLRWKYNVVPENALIDSTEFNKLFGVGNAGMIISAGDYPRKVVQYGMGPDDSGIMALPAGPKRHVTMLGGSIYSVSPEATDDQIDAAMRWIEDSCTYEVTEDYKLTQENKMKEYKENNQLIGIKDLSIWSKDAESLQWYHQLIDENVNCNINHVRLYNEFVADCPAEIQTEEPVCAQELYQLLGSCIEEVLVNKDADCAKLLEAANSDFQSNYLDNLTY